MSPLAICPYASYCEATVTYLRFYIQACFSILSVCRPRPPRPASHAHCRHRHVPELIYETNSSIDICLITYAYTKINPIQLLLLTMCALRVITKPASTSSSYLLTCLLQRRRQTNTVRSARIRFLPDADISCDICASRDAMTQFPARVIGDGPDDWRHVYNAKRTILAE